MSKRKAVQDMLKLSNGMFLGILKRDNITQDLLNKDIADSFEEIEQWQEEIIIELYHEVIDEPFDKNITMSIKLNQSIEEQIGAIEFMLDNGVNTQKLRNQRVYLIRKLYNELEYVKEFNDIVNKFKEEEEEGEEQ